MPGAYLTGAEKRAIERNNWNAIINDIQQTLDRVERQSRLKNQLPLLRAMLKAANEWNGSGVIRSGRKLCRMTRKVPPGCYFQSGKAFGLPGQRLYVPKNDALWTLALVHPQIFR